MRLKVGSLAETGQHPKHLESCCHDNPVQDAGPLDQLGVLEPSHPSMCTEQRRGQKCCTNQLPAHLQGQELGCRNSSLPFCLVLGGPFCSQ